MTPWLDDGDVRLYHGDALERLREMPSESVHMIVTSPPFWGLRDYGTGTWTGGDDACDHTPQTKPERKFTNGRGEGTGDEYAGSNLRSWTTRDGTPFGLTCGRCGAARVDQQIGLEETPDEWCARLVSVMREARRVLRSDGVCWIELGDTYNGSSGNGGATEKQSTNVGSFHDGGVRKAPGLKPKDLVGAPWLLAFALRADGWYLRSDTIWSRPNPMPESVTDRPTKAHSYVFLLTKNARYYYDADAIRESAQDRPQPAPEDKTKDANGTAWLNNRYAPGASGYGHNPAGRNARSVWSIPTEPTPFAHFATFPQTLVERCIKAGTSEHGSCSECGAPWRRVVEKGEPELRAWSANGAGHVNQSGSREEGSTLKHAVPRSTLGWEPTCPCFIGGVTPTPDVAPCVVLDPFMGSGTTALVARRLGRHALGVELNAEYLAIAAKRLEQLSLLTGDAT